MIATKDSGQFTDDGKLQRARLVEKLQRQVLRMVRDGRMLAILRFVVDTAYAEGCAFNAPCRRRALAALQLKPRHGRGAPWSAEEREITRRMYNDGATYAEIALAIGRPLGGVEQAIRQGRIDVGELRPNPRAPIPDDVLDEALRLRGKGMTWVAIADHLGYTDTAITRRLRKDGRL